ncbi:MAG: hypothetical protein AMJ79_08200 [Phycisphaerae bacterium SM23_30]|nr:MAG: hypothetical protein AMJ79_08200 [Phycisphaerae bacterium SM23_30]
MLLVPVDCRLLDELVMVPEALLRLELLLLVEKVREVVDLLDELVDDLTAELFEDLPADCRAVLEDFEVVLEDRADLATLDDLLCFDELPALLLEDWDDLVLVDVLWELEDFDTDLPLL